MPSQHCQNLTQQVTSAFVSRRYSPMCPPSRSASLKHLIPKTWTSGEVFAIMIKVSRYLCPQTEAVALNKKLTYAYAQNNVDQHIDLKSYTHQASYKNLERFLWALTGKPCPAERITLTGKDWSCTPGDKNGYWGAPQDQLSELLVNFNSAYLVFKGLSSG